MEKIISKTPLYNFHKNAGAKMAPFAGYDMPISYPLGTLKEHLWCRENAGLFDVSHMGQFILKGEKAVNVLSHLTPTNFKAKKLGKNVYTHLMNDKGGIRDDLIATKLSDTEIYMVLNAACKESNAQYIQSQLPEGVVLEELAGRALMALQGPKAVNILQEFCTSDITEMPYMTLKQMDVNGVPCFVSRSGYTGEDGFEISVGNVDVENLWQTLLKSPDVEAIGLAARDSLRLEAGLPLYGHDITETTTPLEAGLGWIISKDHSGYVGANVIEQQKAEGITRKLVGVQLLDKGIAREGAELFSTRGEKIGALTSGGHSPSLKCAIGMGYVNIDDASTGTEIFVNVRGKKLKAVVCSPRFITRD